MNNQTQESWLVDISESDFGTGLFLSFTYTPFMQSPSLSMISITSKFNNEPLKKIVLPECTYLECIKEGNREGILAFKWIPNKIASEDLVVKQANDCKKVMCVSKCARYGCLCLEGKCR
jgi:hypothetical protein